jgi:hypothetical protein
MSLLPDTEVYDDNLLQNRSGRLDTLLFSSQQAAPFFQQILFHVDLRDESADRPGKGIYLQNEKRDGCKDEGNF